jgi:GxxExxY protein
VDGSVVWRRTPPRMSRVVPPEWNELSRCVIGGAIEVHTALGAGLAEKVYEDALVVELGLRSIEFQRQCPVRLVYKGVALSEQRLDMVIGKGLLVLELKAIEAVPDHALIQLVSYMRAADAPLGLLINFHAAKLKDGLYRRINPDSTCFGTEAPALRHSIQL